MFGSDPVRSTPPGPGRFLLWVDAVGGYLVSAADVVTIGQPEPGPGVEIPIQGDLSGRHARICRDGEGYVIEPRRPVVVGKRFVHDRTNLVDGTILELGSVRLRFRIPHPLSASARLEILGGHRLLPAGDAVLLMAESLVLGPEPTSHVVCPNWSGRLVLFRQEGQLCCRSEGEFEVDGVTRRNRGSLTTDSRIQGEDFSLSLESV